MHHAHAQRGRPPPRTPSPSPILYVTHTPPIHSPTTCTAAPQTGAKLVSYVRYVPELPEQGNFSTPITRWRRTRYVHFGVLVDRVDADVFPRIPSPKP